MASETVSALGEGFLSYSDKDSRAKALQMAPKDLCNHLHELFTAQANALNHAEQLLRLAIKHLPNDTDCDATEALLHGLKQPLGVFDKGIAEIAGGFEAALLRLDAEALRTKEVAHG